MITNLFHFIDALNERLGKTIAWLALLMGWTQASIIGLLFFFSVGSLQLQESILYMNGTLFMLALGWTYKHDDHVRVDLFYRQMSKERKAKVNFIGILLFLLPLSLVMLWTSAPYALKAWIILEGSRETGGIPALFLLKTIIPLSALLLACQAISEAARAYKTIKQEKK